jgi:5-methylthioadenosine/S-adenosylhomocysteine deaminase
MDAKTADILITNGLLLAMDKENTCIAPGALAIVGDRIAARGPADDFADWQASQVIDAAGGIVMPGLINTHTHAAMTCFRGLADDLPLMSWLNDFIFPAEAQLDEHKVYWGALLACAEMIMSGTTTFCDMYLFEGAVAEAARQAGMRAVVGEVLYDFPSPNYGPIERGFAYTEELIDRYREDALVSIAVEPHSPYLCSPDLLRTAFHLSQTHGIPMVIHLAETAGEVEQVRRRYDCTPVAHLARLGVLAPQVLACHCVVLTEHDIALLEEFDVKVSHNPESNMKLASGVAPVPALLEAGICVGLGTDGCASNNNLDLFLEMDSAAKLHKAVRLDPTVMDARLVAKMATLEGARALGLDGVTGSLEVGKKADVIIIDTHKAHLVPMYHPCSHLVYAVRGSDVAGTIVNGRLLMQAGRLLTLDLERIISEVNRFAAQLSSSK